MRKKPEIDGALTIALLKRREEDLKSYDDLFGLKRCLYDVFLPRPLFQSFPFNGKLTFGARREEQRYIIDVALFVDEFLALEKCGGNNEMFSSGQKINLDEGARNIWTFTRTQTCLEATSGKNTTRHKYVHSYT